MSDVVLFGNDPIVDLFDGDRFAAGYSLPGFTEVDKLWLEGVPHVITRVTFWVPTKGIGHCSVEAYTGTTEMILRALRRGKIPATALNGDAPIVEAKEAVVYSDGGTGIRRTLVKMFQQFGLIDVGHEKLPEEGPLGECRYDVPWVGKTAKDGWTSFTGTRMQGSVQVPSIQENHNGDALRINVLGGLQKSEYSNETGDSTTWYLK